MLPISLAHATVLLLQKPSKPRGLACLPKLSASCKTSLGRMLPRREHGPAAVKSLPHRLTLPTSHYLNSTSFQLSQISNNDVSFERQWNANFQVVSSSAACRLLLTHMDLLGLPKRRTRNRSQFVSKRAKNVHFLHSSCYNFWHTWPNMFVPTYS